MKKATLNIRRVSAEDIASFFRLDSPGYFIARDAECAGEIAGAADVIEIIVLVNKLYEIELRERIMRELSRQYGKDTVLEYLQKADTSEGAQFVLAKLGKDRFTAIARETMAYVRKESAVGSGKNDPTKAAQRPKSKKVDR